MPRRIQARYHANRDNRKSLFYTFAIFIFFWTAFDALMAYAVPLIIDGQGFSHTMLGIIYGSSSISGAVFDFLVCKIFRKIHYRRFFLIMFLFCSVYPLILWGAHSVFLFLIAMAVWGIYYDLYAFGVFDYVSRYSKKEDCSARFGLIQIFQSLADIIIPILAGIIIIEYVDWKTFSFSWLFLGFAVVVFFFLVMVSKRYKPFIVHSECERRKSFFVELHLWRKLSRTMFPVLALSCFLFSVEAFFWTLAPLFAESSTLGVFGGVFLAAYTFPPLITGWIVRPLTRRFGKKRTAFVAMFLGCFTLATFSLWSDPYSIIGVIFVASFFLNFAFPSASSVYTDFASEKPLVESEIKGLEDFSMNIAYVVGPMLAGFFSDFVGIQETFSLVGFAGVILSLILVKITPKHITIRVQQKDLKN